MWQIARIAQDVSAQTFSGSPLPPLTSRSSGVWGASYLRRTRDPTRCFSTSFTDGRNRFCSNRTSSYRSLIAVTAVALSYRT